MHRTLRSTDTRAEERSCYPSPDAFGILQAKATRVAFVIVVAVASTILMASAQIYRNRSPGCEWSSFEPVGEPGQRVDLVGNSTKDVLAVSRRIRTADGRLPRLLALHSIEGGALPVPRMPDDFEAVHASFDNVGRLRLFWTAGRANAPSSHDQAGVPSRGLFTAVMNAGIWSDSEAVYGGEVRANGARGIVFDSANQVHFVTTGYVPGSTMPKLLYVVGTDSAWATTTVPVAAALYPRLVELPSALLLISIGAVEGARDVNSVWSTRYDLQSETWERPVLISRSGVRGAFEPAVHASGNRLDVIWTRDLDGERGTRESLWHAYSKDGGRNWSKPAQVSSARHIRRPVLIRLDEGRLAAFYLQSPAFGAPGAVYAALLDHGKWRMPTRVVTARTSDFNAVASSDGAVHLGLAAYRQDTRDRPSATYHLIGFCGAGGSRKSVS